MACFGLAWNEDLQKAENAKKKAEREKAEEEQARLKAEREKAEERRSRQKAEEGLKSSQRQQRDLRVALEEANQKITTYDQEKQDERVRAQTDENILKGVVERRLELIECFEKQMILLIGVPGCGKSSIINSFNFVVNLCFEDPTAFVKVADVSDAVGRTKTMQLKQYGPETRIMYKKVPDEKRRKCPTFFDLCGLPNRCDIPVRRIIKGLAEGKFDVGSPIFNLLQQRTQDLPINEQRSDMASWVVIFVVDACAEFPNVLAMETYEALDELERTGQGCRLFVVVTKEDKLQEDKDEKLDAITNHIVAAFNFAEDDILKLINFLPNDRDERGEMKPILEKQSKFIDVFRRILEYDSKPEWVEES
jgi:GTP-binding protein EngB required for normal cell division